MHLLGKMLSRRFCTTPKILNSKTHFAPVYAKIFNHDCFKSLRDRLPSGYDHFDPYQLSQFINNTLDSISISNEQMSLIHNRLIEELSQYEYGISTVHTKRLKALGGALSNKSIIEIIKNNPGRVHDSWELLIQTPRSCWNDDLLLATLESTISTKALEENGKKILPLKCLAQCILIYTSISDRKRLDTQILNVLVDDILDKNATEILPLVLNGEKESLKPFLGRMESLTPGQIYQIYKNYSLELLAAEEKLFLEVVNTLGMNRSISLSQEELSAGRDLQEQLQISGEESEIIEDPRLKEKINLRNLEDDYSHVKKYTEGKKLDRTSFTLAKQLLRIEGMYKDAMNEALKLYHSYLLCYRNRADELMFEIFLCFASQSYKLPDPNLLSCGQAFISANNTDQNIVNTVRALILANSKFDPKKSLDIYNANIEAFLRKNDNASASGSVTESLIMAYLANQDLDFARVIFDGALREKVLLGATITKRVKDLFKLYGEAVEGNRTQQVMDEEILKTFKTL